MAESTNVTVQIGGDDKLVQNGPGMTIGDAVAKAGGPRGAVCLVNGVKVAESDPVRQGDVIEVLPTVQKNAC